MVVPLLISEGAFAQVYKLNDPSSCRPLAIKRFLPGRLTLAHASREVAALRRLGVHSNLVELMHAAEPSDPAAPYEIVLAYYPLSLRDVLARYRDQFEDAAVNDCAYQLACGIEFLHRCGVV